MKKMFLAGLLALAVSPLVDARVRVVNKSSSGVILYLRRNSNDDLFITYLGSGMTLQLPFEMKLISARRIINFYAPNLPPLHNLLGKPDIMFRIPELVDKVSEAVITITNEILFKDSYNLIIPTEKELQAQWTKEHQAAVKPKIQEAVPQFPSGVTNFVTEYCTPEEEPKKE